MIREFSGLTEIVDAFDGVPVDQFGVLRDGRAPFPGARRLESGVLPRHARRHFSPAATTLVRSRGGR